MPKLHELLKDRTSKEIKKKYNIKLKSGKVKSSNHTRQSDKCLVEKCPYFSIQCSRNSAINKNTKITNKQKGVKENPLCKDIKSPINDISEKQYKNFSFMFNKQIEYFCENEKVTINNSVNTTISYYNNIAKYLLNKAIILEKSLTKLGYEKIDSDFTKNLNTRMVIGLGEVSAREVSMKLDHIYGIPYIPASTLKGGYRNFMEKEYQFYKEGKEFKDLISKLFGTEDNEGGLVFIDTYPEQGFEIEKDIMNPHYPNYYTKGNVPPTDDQDPKPIFFITLKKAKFKFNIFIQKKLCNSETVDLIKDSFELFLNNEALGAKKAVGYGYFKAKEE